MLGTLIDKFGDRFFLGISQVSQYIWNTYEIYVVLKKIRTRKSKYISVCDYFHTGYLVGHMIISKLIIIINLSSLYICDVRVSYGYSI